MGSIDYIESISFLVLHLCQRTFVHYVFLLCRRHSEAFGDFTARVGFPALKEFQAAHAPAAPAASTAGNGDVKAASDIAASVSLDASTLKVSHPSYCILSPFLCIMLDLLASTSPCRSLSLLPY